MTVTPQHRLTNKNLDTMTADCAACGPGIALKWKNHSPGKRVAVCRLKVNRAIRKTPSTKRVYAARDRPSRHHGMTRAERVAWLSGRRCQGCGTTDDLRADHCHATGKLRDALCNNCNVALGLVKEDPAVLRALAAYVEHHG